LTNPHIRPLRLPMDAVPIRARAVARFSDGPVGLLRVVRRRTSIRVQRDAHLRMRGVLGEVPV
jgi:hypothetical protein